jgi:hypothetical protein
LGRSPHWAEVQIVDESGAPIAKLAVVLVKSDGERVSIETGADGVARWENLDEGEARLDFGDSDFVYEERP